jgi:hypothetical protein
MNYNKAMNNTPYDDYSDLRIKKEEETPWMGFEDSKLNSDDYATLVRQKLQGLSLTEIYHIISTCQYLQSSYEK